MDMRRGRRFLRKRFSVFSFRSTLLSEPGASNRKPKTEKLKTDNRDPTDPSLQRRIIRVLEQFFHLVAHWEIEIDALGRDRGEEPFLI
jgi:hypothetical protein